MKLIVKFIVETFGFYSTGYKYRSSKKGFSSEEMARRYIKTRPIDCGQYKYMLWKVTYEELSPE